MESHKIVDCLASDGRLDCEEGDVVVAIFWRESSDLFAGLRMSGVWIALPCNAPEQDIKLVSQFNLKLTVFSRVVLNFFV
jgi:hypothetical protein